MCIHNLIAFPSVFIASHLADTKKVRQVVQAPIIDKERGAWKDPALDHVSALQCDGGQ